MTNLQPIRRSSHTYGRYSIGDHELAHGNLIEWLEEGGTRTGTVEYTYAGYFVRTPSGSLPLRELVRNALRMRPDRIIVGEVRGREVLDMLQAANTGHRGLLTTLHAGGPEEVPARLEAMALAAPGARLDVVRRLVGGGIDAVVHLERAPTGRPTRRVTVVAEENELSIAGQIPQRPTPGDQRVHRQTELRQQWRQSSERDCRGRECGSHPRRRGPVGPG